MTELEDAAKIQKELMLDWFWIILCRNKDGSGWCTIFTLLFVIDISIELLFDDLLMIVSLLTASFFFIYSLGSHATYKVECLEKLAVENVVRGTEFPTT